MTSQDSKAEIHFVCITIFEARHLAWSTMDPLVCIQVGDMKKYTVARENTNRPYYNEYFVFEFRVPFEELMDKIITISVHQARHIFKCRKLLGNMRLDVATVWLQTSHQFYHKWALLTDPSDPAGVPKGYVKCDISVIGKGDVVSMPPSMDASDDDIEGNLLVPESMSQGRQRAHYVFRVHRADSLPRANCALVTNMKKALTGTACDMPDPVVQISFGGFTGKTSVQKRTLTPVWDQQLIFTDVFPPLGQRVKVQLRDRNSGGVIATHFLDIGAIADNGVRGFLPTFGPSFVHLYGAHKDQEQECCAPRWGKAGPTAQGDGASYRGRLLLSLDTETLDGSPRGGAARPPLGVEVKLNKELVESQYWENGDVLLVGVLFEASMLDRKMVDKSVHVEISLGNAGNMAVGSGQKMMVWNDDSEELEVLLPPWCRSCTALMAPPPPPKDRVYCSLLLNTDKPCVYVQSTCPDMWQRMYNSNKLARLAEHLSSSLSEVRPLLHRRDADAAASRLGEALDALAAACRAYVSGSAGDDCRATVLDRNRGRRCREELESIDEEATAVRKTLTQQSASSAFRQARRYLRRLEHIVEDPQHALPDVFVWLLCAGKRVGFQRIPARELMFSEEMDECGYSCGHLQTLLLQTPVKKNVTVPSWVVPGKLGMYLWLGPARHRDVWTDRLPPGYNIEEVQGKSDQLTDTNIPTSIRYTDSMMFQGRVHLYQGRITPGADSTGLCTPFVRVFFGDQCQATQVKSETLNPTWDQMLLFPKISIDGSSAQYLIENPPTIIVELMDQDPCHKTELVGRAMERPVTKLVTQPYTGPQFPPSLAWVPMFRGKECTAEVLAAFELLQLDEDLELLDVPQDVGSGPVLPIPSNIKPTLVGYRLEVLFWGLRDLKRVHLSSVNRPRVSVECAGVVLHSSVLQSARRSLNFSSPRKHIDLELPEDPNYHPAIMIKVADCRTFGRFTYVGCHVVRHIQEYETQLVTEMERQERRTNLPLNNTSSLDSISPDSLVNEQFGQRYSIEKKYFPIDSKNTWDYLYNMVFCTKQKAATIVVSSRRWRQLKLSETETEEERDWWTKYYEAMELGSKSDARQAPPSRGDDASDDGGVTVAGDKVERPATQKAALKVYTRELEAQPEFHGFTDWLFTLNIFRGKWISDETVEGINVMCKFKGAMKLYRWPPSNSELVTPTGLAPDEGVLVEYPPNDSLRVLVRVYVVKGICLTPKDYTGKSDPYVMLEIGRTKVSNRDEYKPRDINPVFGKCFELQATFPYDYSLTVRVMDWDRTTADDLIGETKIDLENRFYSNHRAACGIASRYDSDGYNMWRDYMKPTQILENMCKQFNVDGPHYSDNSIEVGPCRFDMVGRMGTAWIGNVSREDLALEALQRWHQIPVVGCRLVPEHVETRSLYNPRKSGIEQGKLQLWVDIFPLVDKLPPAVDISPRTPQAFELRCIVWNTMDVVLVDSSLFSKERTSDIYVKGWLTGPEDCQNTDVHYHSITGEGNFNWRFVFPFEFVSAENKIVVYKKESLFALTETELNLPCRLSLQVWDNDYFSPDDFIGQLNFELRRIPRGAKSSRTCKLNITAEDAMTINLFKAKRTRGWWPFQDVVEGHSALMGKVELELQILTLEEAQIHPAGKGRAEPESLPKPQRPESSLTFFQNPLKAMYYTVCRQHRADAIKLTLLALVVLLILVGVYSVPGYTVKKLLHV